LFPKKQQHSAAASLVLRIAKPTSVSKARRYGMNKTVHAAKAKWDLDERLDSELEDTFPASDPLTVTRGRPGQDITPEPSDANDKPWGPFRS
jgi:hypothetical protein